MIHTRKKTQKAEIRYRFPLYIAHIHIFSIELFYQLISSSLGSEGVSVCFLASSKLASYS